MNAQARRLQAALLLGKTIGIRIRGMSMMPLIKPGDVVQARAIERDIRLGDLVLIEYNEQIVCHRICEILSADKSYRTKGDHNKFPDGMIAQRENILALATLREDDT